MSMTFTKLFSSITESTIWTEPDHVRIVWITMLAMADSRGRVWASIPGLANRARVQLGQCEEALARFKAPDKYSRTPDNDGVRIAEIDGGWRLLNHEKYRSIRDEEAIRESKRKYINTRRAIEAVENVEQCRTPSNAVDRSRHNAEADAEAEKTICNNSTGHPSLKDVLTNGEFIGMAKEASEAFWHHFEASGWIDKNGHEIKNWRSKQTAWKNNMVSLKAEKEHHARPQGHSANRPMDIKTIIQAKESLAAEIRKKFCSDTAIDSVWSDKPKRDEFFKLKREIKELNTQLSNMA